MTGKSKSKDTQNTQSLEQYFYKVKQKELETFNKDTQNANLRGSLLDLIDV